MESQEIQKIVDIFEKSTISVMDLEIGEMKIRLEKNSSAAVPQALVHMPAADAAINLPAAQNEPKKSSEEIRSPLVGIFYSCSKPGAPAYVQAGDVVKKGDVLCIVEAMKTMNELKSDRDGKITAILAADGDLVEYDQPLFEMEPLA